MTENRYNPKMTIIDIFDGFGKAEAVASALNATVYGKEPTSMLDW